MIRTGNSRYGAHWKARYSRRFSCFNEYVGTQYTAMHWIDGQGKWTYGQSVVWQYCLVDFCLWIVRDPWRPRRRSCQAHEWRLAPKSCLCNKNVVRRLEVCLDPCDVFFYCARQPKVNIFPKVALQNDMDCSGGAGARQHILLPFFHKKDTHPKKLHFFAQEAARTTKKSTQQIWTDHKGWATFLHLQPTITRKIPKTKKFPYWALFSFSATIHTFRYFWRQLTSVLNQNKFSNLTSAWALATTWTFGVMIGNFEKIQ